ncbi:unnamed protein product, partial [Polarella glacialis]
ADDRKRRLEELRNPNRPGVWDAPASKQEAEAVQKAQSSSDRRLPPPPEELAPPPPVGSAASQVSGGKGGDSQQNAVSSTAPVGGRRHPPPPAEMAPPPGTTTRHTVVRPGMPAHLDPRGPGRPFGRPPADGPPPERPPPPVRQVPSPSLRPQEEHLKPTPPSVMGDSVWGDDSSLPQEFGGSGPALNVFPELGGSGPQSKKDRKQALLANLAANQAADSSKVSKPAEAPWSQASRGTGSYSLE